MQISLESARLESTRSESDGAVRDSTSPERRPLVVDIDEILLHSNLYIEAAFSEIAHHFQAIFGMVAALRGGLRALKRRIVQSTHFDPSRLAYDQETMAFVLRVLSEGRPVYLSSERYDDALVQAVARHLGLFGAWSAHEAERGDPERSKFLPTSGQGFDYLGSETVALPPSASRIARPVARSGSIVAKPDLRSWVKLLRVHQYAKNALVLVPLLTAHQFALAPALKASLAVLAFSLCASGAYILNDLIDVKADRSHPTKRNRPIASGVISPAHATVAMAFLLAGAVAIASVVSWSFLAMVFGYFALSTAYSFWLKRMAIADVITLAILYTVRVIAGAVAIGVPMSEWLCAFSLFIFTSLALVKRYIELKDHDGERLTARDYRASDRPIVGTLAAASGFNAVVIFTLYISSEAVRTLYTRPQLLWIACPILMFWIARTMLLADRGLIDDDPVVFALRDRVSWLALGGMCIVMFAAI